MLHSPLPLLLAAFSIIYSSHGDEMCSLNQPESIVFIFNDTTGLLNCSVSGQPNMICMDDNQIANGTHLVLGNNEGVYKCCCDCANSGGNCTDPLTLYGTFLKITCTSSVDFCFILNTFSKYNICL